MGPLYRGHARLDSLSLSKSRDRRDAGGRMLTEGMNMRSDDSRESVEASPCDGGRMNVSGGVFHGVMRDNYDTHAVTGIGSSVGRRVLD
jgi:hypothetical protein